MEDRNYLKTAFDKTLACRSKKLSDALKAYNKGFLEGLNDVVLDIGIAYFLCAAILIIGWPIWRKFIKEDNKDN